MRKLWAMYAFIFFSLAFSPFSSMNLYASQPSSTEIVQVGHFFGGHHDGDHHGDRDGRWWHRDGGHHKDGGHHRDGGHHGGGDHRGGHGGH